MTIMEKLQEMSETVEQLSIQVEDLKQDIKHPENLERIEVMVTAINCIKHTIEFFKPYEH